VISSGVHEGPQPPDQHAVSAGKSKTSTVTTGLGIIPPSSGRSRGPGTSGRKRHTRYTGLHRRRSLWRRGTRRPAAVVSRLWGRRDAQDRQATGRTPTGLSSQVARKNLLETRTSIAQHHIPHRVYLARPGECAASLPDVQVGFAGATACTATPATLRHTSRHAPPADTILASGDCSGRGSGGARERRRASAARGP
jgi:hypothetical protein